MKIIECYLFDRGYTVVHHNNNFIRMYAGLKTRGDNYPKSDLGVSAPQKGLLSIKIIFQMRKFQNKLLYYWATNTLLTLMSVPLFQQKST